MKNYIYPISIVALFLISVVSVKGAVKIEELCANQTECVVKILNEKIR